LVRVSRRVGNRALTHLRATRGEPQTAYPKPRPGRSAVPVSCPSRLLSRCGRCPPFPTDASGQPCLTQRRVAGGYPDRRLSSNLDFRFTLDGFHALLAPRTRCFSAFPYGTFTLSVTTLSYLALDGQHHPYSASTFKLTYSRESPNRRNNPPGRM